MNTRSPLPVPPWMLAVAAMFSVQLGSALSVPMISQVGPAGTAWLRLSAGALIFLAVARPALRTLNRRDLPESTLFARSLITRSGWSFWTGDSRQNVCRISPIPHVTADRTSEPVLSESAAIAGIDLLLKPISELTK